MAAIFIATGDRYVFKKCYKGQRIAFYEYFPGRPIGSTYMDYDLRDAGFPAEGIVNASVS